MSVNVIKATKVHLQTAPFRMKAPTIAYDQNSSSLTAATSFVSNDFANDEASVTPSQDRHTLLIEKARDEASRTVLVANQQAAEVLRAAQTQGFETGRSEWHAAHDAEIKATLQAAERIFEESRLWRTEMLARSEQTVVSLVKDVAQKLFGEGFELPVEQLQVVVNRALEQARHLGNPRVRLHPEDAALLKPLCPTDLVLVPDDSVKRGGCVIEAERGAVDSQIATQLNAISKTLDNS